MRGVNTYKNKRKYVREKGYEACEDCRWKHSQVDNGKKKKESTKGKSNNGLVVRYRSLLCIFSSCDYAVFGKLFLSPTQHQRC